MADMKRARLIPITGITNSKDAEQRATSALLAVISVVRDFSNALLGQFGASKATRAIVDCFTEVEVTLASGQKVRPDGLIRVSYGSTSWNALVEVKTGDAKLDAEQLNNYVTAARETNADAVLSISNELGAAGSHTTAGVKVRSNSKVQVHHLSWMEILSAAVQRQVHAGVADPEQAWILSELIRYLEHPKSGAVPLSDMGPSWVSVRDGARNSSLRKSMSEVADVALCWDQLMQQSALHLSSQTGVTVTQRLPRAEQEPRARLAALAGSLSEEGQLGGVLRIPGAAAELEVVADLRSRQIAIHCSLDAPADKLGRGSVSWLLRQLAEAPADLTVESFARNARTGQSAALRELRDDPNLLLGDSQQDIAKFRLSLRRAMGENGRSGGRKPGFIESTNSAIGTFYEFCLQQVTPWKPTAPKVARPATTASEPQPIRTAAASVIDLDEHEQGEPVASASLTTGVETNPT